MAELLTVSAVAEMINVGRQTAYRLIWSGELPTVDVRNSGRRPRLRVERSAVDAWIRSRRMAERPGPVTS